MRFRGDKIVNAVGSKLCDSRFLDTRSSHRVPVLRAFERFLGRAIGKSAFAATIAIVGLGQLLVVQQGGFDLSLPGAVSLAVVVSTHHPHQDDGLLYQAVLLAIAFALVAGFLNGILVSFFRLNAIIATIGTNALLYGAVFATSGGVPRSPRTFSPRLLAARTLGLPNSVYFVLGATAIVSFLLKKTVVGRRFEAIGANPLAGRAAGLRVRLHQMMAYVYAQLLYCLAGILIAGITRSRLPFRVTAYCCPPLRSWFLAGPRSSADEAIRSRR